ncbi:MAG: hypothetical protein KF775_13695 [Cyclobacteriaceae bacterium]|jgi:hypothetical protein|nr:hypothetical protein [Cyclobacteriaceae bacterium]
MIDLTPKLFIAPTIALALVGICYVYNLKRVIHKQLFGKFMVAMSSIGFAVNFTWETLHAPLYQGHRYTINSFSISALASVADAIMLILLYSIFSLILKDPYWVSRLSLSRILYVALVGGIGAAVSEVLHIHAGDWTYATTMPIIPVANVGISPVLQFMIVPLLVYWTSSFLLRGKSDSNLTS